MADSAVIDKEKATGNTGLRLVNCRRLGKYHLVKGLGKGGTCEVWKARDCVEGIWVTLKIPLVGINGVRNNQKLTREIRFVTKLRHPHIMPVKNVYIIDDHAGEDFGTPGYVAPVHAYGYPTYRSDCFAVGLILHEYLTGTLPRRPFRWPPRGYECLRERTNLSIVKFLKQSLLVDPDKRFANAGKMLTALSQSRPKSLQTTFVLKNADTKFNAAGL